MARIVEETKMCLDIVSEEKPEPSGYFWKVFLEKKSRRTGKTTIFPLYRGTKAIRRGRWLKADEVGIFKFLGKLLPSPNYLSGFHGYSSHEEAVFSNRYGGGVIVKCEYDEGHIQGTQDGMRIIVARKMRVPKEEDEAL